jgi:FdhD protein
VTSGMLYNNRKVIKYSKGCFNTTEETVVKEIQVEVYLNGIYFTSLICSPEGYNELAAGFLVSQGLIQRREEIKEIKYREENGKVNVYVSLARENPRSIKSSFKPVNTKATFKAPELLKLMSLLEDRSGVFRITGGVHNAALGNGESLISMFEDIGRHNAVDKVLGFAFLNKVPVDDKCLVLSGRIALEILAKAARSGIPLVLSRSAPMQMAVDLAEELGISIVGFTRGDRFYIYTNPQRVVL